MGEYVSESMKRLREKFEVMREASDTPEMRAAIAKWEADQAAAVVNERARIRQRRGIPEVFWSRLDSPDESVEAFRVVRDFLASDAKFCLLLGTAGRGKSFSAAWVIDKVGGLFVDAIRLAQASYFDDDVSAALIATPVLALDELGMEGNDEKGWYESKLYGVLNARYQRNRRTILAGNLMPSQFLARYGSEQLSRLWDRIEPSSMRAVLTGPSLRKGEP